MSEESRIAWELVALSLLPWMVFGGAFGYSASKRFSADNAEASRKWTIRMGISLGGVVIWTLVMTWMLTDFSSFPLNR